MDDVLLVHELEPFGHLPDDVRRLLLGQLPLLLHLLQRAVGQQLQHQVQRVLVVEVPVERGAVAVVQIRLQLYLSDYVLLHLRLPDAPLRHLLYHAHEPQLLLLRRKHLPERALPQLVQQLEVVDGELALRPHRSALQKDRLLADPLPQLRYASCYCLAFCCLWLEFHREVVVEGLLLPELDVAACEGLGGLQVVPVLHLAGRGGLDVQVSGHERRLLLHGRDGERPHVLRVLGRLEDLDALRCNGLALLLALLQEVEVLCLEQLVAAAAVGALAVPLLLEIDARRHRWLHALKESKVFLQSSFAGVGTDADRLPASAPVLCAEVVRGRAGSEGVLGEYLAGEGIAFLLAQVDDRLILGNRRVIRKFFRLGGDVLGHALQLAEACRFGAELCAGEDHGLCGEVAGGREGLPPEVGVVAVGEEVAGRGESAGCWLGEIEGRVYAGDCQGLGALVIVICRHHLL